MIHRKIIYSDPVLNRKPDFGVSISLTTLCCTWNEYGTAQGIAWIWVFSTSGARADVLDKKSRQHFVGFHVVFTTRWRSTAFWTLCERRCRSLASSLLNRSIIWLAPRADKMKWILRNLWVATRAGKLGLSCPLGIARLVSAKFFGVKLVRSRCLDIGLVIFFLRFYGPQLRLGPKKKNAKKEFGQYPAILTARLVGNAYMYHSSSNNGHFSVKPPKQYKITTCNP